MRRNVVLVFCVVVAGIAAAQPADFGDALMEPIPTLLANGGPYHLDTTQEWIGSSPTSTTTTEADALPTDFNDGYIEVSEVYLDNTFNLMGQVRVPVTTSENTSVRYLNVALDLNNDGVFCTYPVGMRVQYEWAVVNLPVVYTGETKVVTAYFTLHSPLVTAKARATLSTEPIDPAPFGPNGWDGSGPVGGFLRGETEDFSSFTCDTYYHTRYPNAISIPLPPVVYDPPNRPFPTPPVYETPRGPGLVCPVGEVPSQPGTGEPLDIPEIDEPDRLDNDPVANPIIDKDSVKNMPDIKQGDDECVPASTANSLRYLLNRSGETVTDDEAFNRNLFEKLRDAMKTNQGSAGTQIDPENPENNNFINGKKTAKIHDKIRNAKVTTIRGNPSRNNIINAIKQKMNVEIVVYCYENNALPPVLKHMVTVVGFVEYADGRIELKIHNPNDRKTGEGSGDTASEPRETTLTILPGQSDRGGLIVRGLVRKDGGTNDVFEIQMMFAEHLASENINVTIEPPVTSPIEGQPMELIATALDKNKAVTHYQWIKDDTDIPGANSPIYYLDSAIPLDSGEYTCWAYDETTETYGISNAISVIVVSDDAVPLSSIATMIILSIVLSSCAALIFRQKRRVQKQ